MSNTITGFCEYTGKEQTLYFDNDIVADTINSDIALQGRYKCNNTFCPKSECFLYNKFINNK